MDMEKKGRLSEIEAQTQTEKGERVNVFSRFSLPKQYIWIVGSFCRRQIPARRLMNPHSAGDSSQ